MDQDTRAKAIQAAYDVVAANASAELGYISSLYRDDTYGEDYEILSEETGSLGALADCWVDFEGIVDKVAEILGVDVADKPTADRGEETGIEASRQQSITQHPSNGLSDA